MRDDFRMLLCQIVAYFWCPCFYQKFPHTIVRVLAITGAAWFGQNRILENLLMYDLSRHSFREILGILQNLYYRLLPWEPAKTGSIAGSTAVYSARARTKMEMERISSMQETSIGIILEKAFQFGTSNVWSLSPFQMSTMVGEIFQSAVRARFAPAVDAIRKRKWLHHSISGDVYDEVVHEAFRDSDMGLLVNLFRMVRSNKIRYLFGHILVAASKRGDEDLVDFLLDHADWPKIQLKAYPELQAAAVEAAESGNLRILDNLRQHGADMNYDKLVPSPLSRAVAHGQVEVAKWLLDNGADPTSVRGSAMLELSKTLFSPNKEARPSRRREIHQLIDLLHERGVFDPNGSAGHWTLLGAAAHAGEVGLVRKLLKLGADPKYDLDEHINPLIAAVCCHKARTCRELVGLFLDLGLSPNGHPVPLDKFGVDVFSDYRPVVVAAFVNRRKIHDLLVARGATPDEDDRLTVAEIFKQHDWVLMINR